MPWVSKPVHHYNHDDGSMMMVPNTFRCIMCDAEALRVRPDSRSRPIKQILQIAISSAFQRDDLIQPVKSNDLTLGEVPQQAFEMHIGDFRALPFCLRLLHGRLDLRCCNFACRLKIFLFKNLDHLFVLRNGNALPDLLELLVQRRI